MARKLPIVRGTTLIYQQQGNPQALELGTAAWERWLLDATSFVVEHERGSFTVSRERAGNQRGGWYWRAYRMYGGARQRVYVGKTEDLTPARLHEVAALLTGDTRALMSQADHAFAEESRAYGRGRDVPVEPARQSLRRSQRVLIATKLCIPPVRAQVLLRSRLHERLRQVTQHPLTLISAPAGFGKTTLLSEWAASIRREVEHKTAPDAGVPVAWLSLDESDNDPMSFWRYFIAALEALQPGVGEDAEALLDSAQSVSVDVLLAVLINTLNTLPRDHVLVLDDYHLIEAQSIHKGLIFLLDHMPRRLHLVIAGRAEPPLPLARLRTRAQLYEIHAPDLRFTADEIAIFLNEMLGLDLTQEVIAALDARIEGWIGGVQLAALALRAHQERARFVETFTGSHRHLFDYLIGEVFAQQPAHVQNFLLSTCILERFTGSLCNALTEQSDGQDMLEFLEQSNVFMVPLDEQRAWYRYHHLFAEALRTYLRRLHPEHWPVLHARASRWYADHDFFREAIEYALTAEDFERAALLIEQLPESMLWGMNDFVAPRRWLEQLPPTLLRTRPQLGVLHAWTLWISASVEPTPDCLDRAEARLHDAQAYLIASGESASSTQAIRGKIAAVFAAVLFARGETARVTAYVHQALALLPEDLTSLRYLAARMLFNIYLNHGDTVAADRALKALAALSQATQDTYSALSAQGSMALLQRLQGQLPQAFTSYQRVIQLAEQKLKQWHPGIAYSGLGSILLEWNDLEGAARHLALGHEQALETGDPDRLIYSFRELSSLYWAQGEIARAFGALAEAERILQKYPQDTFGNVLATRRELIARRVRLFLAQGDLAAAQRWTQVCEPLGDEQLTPPRFSELVILAQVYLATDEVQHALRLLERLLLAAEGRALVDTRIQLLTLHALALCARDDTRQAITTIGAALVLGEPGGYVRIFVDMGPSLTALLLQLLDALHTKQLATLLPTSAAYVRTLLAASGHHIPASPVAKYASRLPEPQPHLVVTLSQREREIVQLMAQGLSDREIAQQLVLAENTVKSYAKRIYARLYVHNRTQAVTRAQALHLL
ncbi:MAG: LuxR C-terminal-related transcriptional regulator [Chloroflexota bacterium]|nr:LuxR C-terminal-related transcriptional regulator [Chloroflexota bacterium]